VEVNARKWVDVEVVTHLPTSSSVRGVTLQSGVDYPDEIRLILFSGQVLDASLWGSHPQNFFQFASLFQVVPKQGNVTARLDV